MEYLTRIKRIKSKLYRKNPYSIPIKIYDNHNKKIIVLFNGKEKIFNSEQEYSEAIPSYIKPVKIETIN